MSEEDAYGNTGKETHGPRLLPGGTGMERRQGWGTSFHSRAVQNHHLKNRAAVFGQTFNSLTPTAVAGPDPMTSRGLQGPWADVPSPGLKPRARGVTVFRLNPSACPGSAAFTSGLLFLAH